MLIHNLQDGHVTEQETIRKPLEQEVGWVHLLKPEPAEVMRVVGEVFHCHPLVVEDCTKLNQRPKLDRYKDHIYISFYAVVGPTLTPIEMGIIVGANYVITVSKKHLPFMENLKEELLNVQDRMGHPGIILHRLLDRCVDEYTAFTNQLEDRVDKMERSIYRNPYIHVSREIFQLKRSLHTLRRIIVDEKTIIGTISHQNFPYTRNEFDVYFIDIYDHISRVVDSLDMYRESLSGLLELQMGMKSDRMNTIMKTLTIISCIFLPLTFIVGLYGMNFKNMPELNWEFGYAYVWILLITVGIGMWLIFKWKKWI
ncbi:magnesium/cobalt transporter CorA [Paenibacillus rigui]|uniref:Magnesium transport protein CorA n=1 Tax=Paenibacillus rigui TaxID=554312 RepID=A0A229UYD2_9BACL|nr:magnesium/cobalt transporter CorA [Paenibacillus rigui]OXM88393.1 magnesium and cobalt transport protein CorA [Paenibacillus rigui]